jgi:hypothetical protein
MTSVESRVAIWHDDVRPAPEGWLRAHDNPTALRLLREHDVAVISLDHDLGASPDADVWARGCSPDGDGRDLVRAMIAEDLVPPEVRIHSWNPSGAREMAALLHDAGYFNVVVRPYEVAQ